MIKKYPVILSAAVIMLTLLTVAGCAEKKTAMDGDVVKVHYTGRLADGSTFDSSAGSNPLEFTIGDGSMIPGFENALKGMKVGEVKTVSIPADEAYGQRNENLVMELDRSRLAYGVNPVAGDKLKLTLADGRTTLVLVAAVSESTVTIDANHELAGKDLTFKLELIELTRK